MVGRVEKCVCGGDVPDCPYCEGCGEVVILTVQERSLLDAKLSRAGFTARWAATRMTKEQREKFLKIAIGRVFTMEKLKRDKD